MTSRRGTRGGLPKRGRRENVPIPGQAREPTFAVPGTSHPQNPVAGPSRNTSGGSDSPGTSRGGAAGSGRRGTSRGGRGRPPFIIYGKKNQAPREKPIVIGIPSADGGEGPQFDPPNPNPPANYTMTQSNEKYPDWKLYLPREAFVAGSLNERKVAAFEGHISRNAEIYNLHQIHSNLHFNLTLEIVNRDERLQREWENFTSDITNKPEETLAYVSIAMHHRILHFLRNEDIKCLNTISPRVVGYQTTTKLRSIKMNQCDKMICFIGTVARLGPPDSVCTWMAFRCFSCGTPQAVLQPDGLFVQPKKCMNSMCHNKDDFEVLTRSLYTRVTEVQTLLVEESIEDKKRDIFSKPKSIEVILTDDLVNSVQAGGDIRITGVLKLRKDNQMADKAQCGIYCIHAINVISASNPVVKESTEFTENSLRAIEMIKTDPFPLRLLVQSLCPEVRGNEMIKFGFLLSLFSANQSTDKTIRKEVHTLVVGDPGLGKSCLLKACCTVAPRAIFTSCTGSSVSGLTATVKAEKDEGACSIEAGALVLADQGVCCIDEFDKMTSNHASMLEVMEQQRVSVAKSGAICTLPAKTVILAAGNPVNGHYDRSKTVCENIKMHPAILSRFDISFIMLDQHRKDNWFLRDVPTDVPPLNERLELRPGEDMDALPHELFQKYIQYALENVKTRLTDEAGDLLVNFWLKLRRMQDKNDHIPITTRQLVGLMRMTMARARIDLCEETELRHANDVIELMKYSMADVLCPDGGTTVDWQRGMHGSGISQSVRVRTFLNEIQKRAEQKKKKIFHYDEFKSIAEGLRVQRFLNDILDSLNVQGMIINKGNSFYQLL